MDDDKPGARALVVADAEGIIRMWSDGAEALFGYPATDTLGRSVELLIPERFRERHWRAFHAAMATGVIEMDETTTPTLHADGTGGQPRGSARAPQGSRGRNNWRGGNVGHDVGARSG